jgi:hypothetical protein
VVVKNPAGLGRRLGQTGLERGVVAHSGIEKEITHRRECRGERIERLQRARDMSQRTKHRDQIALALLDRAKPREGRERCVACTLQ